MKQYLQSEAAECGLAALAMVADFHKFHVGLTELRRRFPTSMKGARLADLIGIAQKIGFEARAIRLDLDDLGKLRLPCILHWDFNHFIVLRRVGKSSVVVVDPAIGERSISFAEVSEHFTGVALELRPTHDFRPKPPSPAVSVRQLIGTVSGVKRVVAQVLMLSVALQLFVVLAPFYMQWVVDQVLVSSDRDLLTVLGLGFGLALVLQVAIGTLRNWSVIYLSAQMGVQWMGNVFAHLMRLPLAFFEKRHLGDVTSRMSSVQSIQRTLTTSFLEALIDGLMALITLALMIAYSWKLALITLAAVLLYLCVRWFSYRAVRETTELQLIAAAKQETHLLESLRGMQSLKVAGEEPLRQTAYEGLMVNSVNHEVRLAYMGLGFNGANQLIFGIERIAVIWLGALLALDSVFSVGMLVAYLAYKDQFSGRIASLIDKVIDLRMLRLHGERLSEIVLTDPEDVGQYPEIARPEQVSIEFDNVSFRYADGEPWVLSGCSFKVDPGESVAIAGPSGEGKTTLVKLLLGILKPSSGIIRVGGFDLGEVGAKNARSFMGVVMQEDQLFAGTVGENISFFEHGQSQQRIEAAATAAGVHGDIASMPMGYYSLIGDMGSSLSGGQKQRIILARALYREPKLLVLDEATSQLDVENERLVNSAIEELEITRLIIAHRPETIRSADRVLWLQGGKLQMPTALS